MEAVDQGKVKLNGTTLDVTKTPAWLRDVEHLISCYSSGQTDRERALGNRGSN